MNELSRMSYVLYLLYYYMSYVLYLLLRTVPTYYTHLIKNSIKFKLVIDNV